MAEEVIEAFTGGLMLIVLLGAFAILLGVDPTVVSPILTDAVGIFVRLSVIAVFGLLVVQIVRMRK